MDLVQASIPKREPLPPDPAEQWAGKMGLDYAHPSRNPSDVPGINLSYQRRFGVDRVSVNKEMLEGIHPSVSILEVGCSAGQQLNVLEHMGFTRLEGCDVNADALKLCQFPTKVADGRRLPYDSGSFDMVMTSGTLMQIPPDDKKPFMAECCRVAKRWVYGVEGVTPRPIKWDFGDLIPPAWTDVFPDTVMVPGWRLVRARLLQSRDPKHMSLRAYLLERE